MKSYQVMFCCNDDRGNFTGRVSEVSIEDEIRIAAPRLPFKMRQRQGTVVVGRRSYACGAWQTWCGNIFWDSTKLDADTAHMLVADLIESGWAVEEYAESGPFSTLARSAR